MQKELYVTVEEMQKKDSFTNKSYKECSIYSFRYDKPETRSRITFDGKELISYIFVINVTFDGRKKVITENDVLKSMDNLGYINYKNDDNMFPTFNLTNKAKYNSLNTQKAYTYEHAQEFFKKVRELFKGFNIPIDQLGTILGTTDIPNLIDDGLDKIEKTLLYTDTNLL